MGNIGREYAAEYEILELVKLKLYQRMHGLAPVLGALEFCVENRKQEGKEGFLTDGRRVFLDAGKLRLDFLEDSGRLCLEILHMLCHCLLGHPFRAWREGGKRDRERERGRRAWDRECDWEAWKLARELWGSPLPLLKEADRLLEEGKEEEAQELLFVDSHEGWFRLDGRQAAWWQGQGEKLLKSGAPKGKRKAGASPGSRERRLVPAAGERGDYRSVLRGLSAWQEETGLNQEEFQYSWYAYGLQLYGNLPLIEPLEYREERKVSDLAIVIDTSASCEKELVQVFLEETRGILEQEKLFFSRFCLHILQCDNRVQKDDCIRSREEFERYLENLVIRGGGGTDFRPAFWRIGELRRDGELKDLKGILYFTDGCGRYPEEEPDYQVWFVMLQGHFDTIDMPGWIHRLVLEEKRRT